LPRDGIYARKPELARWRQMSRRYVPSSLHHSLPKKAFLCAI